MIQVSEPTSTATSQKAPERTRSIRAPETIEAAVQENSRNAAQNTPLTRAQSAFSSAVVVPVSGGPPRWVPISSDQGAAWLVASTSPLPSKMNGPLGKAK